MRRIVLLFAILLSSAFVTDLAAQEPYAGWNIFNRGITSRQTVLTDLDDNIVHTWESDYGVGAAVYLLDNGRVLRCASDASVRNFGGPGVGGRLEILDWEGNVEWSYVVAGPDYVQHHDCEMLPNGNVLAIIWERYSREELIAVGRDPKNTPEEIWSEAILEIQPVGKTGGNVVWEWHVWDHLVQNFDPALPNFGEPSGHPERIDINFTDAGEEDWLHFNAVSYNPQLDQIAMSSTKFDEFWVISHAPGSNGDLIYRYGNPAAYGRGVTTDRLLWNQHNIHWIEPGLEGAGNFLIFNNGADSSFIRGYSSLDEIVPPLTPSGDYELEKGVPFGPSAPAYSIDNVNGKRFFSAIMSSAQRLANGNTLCNLGRTGEVYEFDANGVLVWESRTSSTTFRVKRIGSFDARLEGLLWESLENESMEVVAGTVLGGGLGDISELDGNVLDVARGTGVIDVEVKGETLFLTPSKINVRLTSKHLLPANTGRNPVVVARNIELFDYNAGEFVTVSTGISTVSPSLLEVDIEDDASRFVEPKTGCIQLRLRFSKTGLARGMRVQIDQLSARVVN